MNFTTITDLANEVCDRLDHDDVDEVIAAIRNNRHTYGFYEDIDEETLNVILRNVWSGLRAGEYPWS